MLINICRILHKPTFENMIEKELVDDYWQPANKLIIYHDERGEDSQQMPLLIFPN